MKWTCKYCSKEYVQEGRFLAHGPKCKVRQRIDRAKTLEGSIAFDAYNYWMKKTRKGEQTFDTFMNSKFFSSCLNFAEFYLKTSIGSMEKYIDFMIKREYGFAMWSSHLVYAEFVHNYDLIFPPEEQWNITFNIIEQYCVDFKCTPKEVFEKMGFDEITRLIIKRKLSSWYLMPSSSFWAWVGSLSDLQKSQITDALKPDVFMNIAQANPVIFKELKEWTQEVEI